MCVLVLSLWLTRRFSGMGCLPVVNAVRCVIARGNLWALTCRMPRTPRRSPRTLCARFVAPHLRRQQRVLEIVGSDSHLDPCR